MSREKVKIFGVPFDNLTTAQISSILLERIKAGENDEPFVVFTPNPEIVMAAEKDKALMCCLKKADILSADGVGIVWASKFFGAKIKERASGYDIVQELFRRASLQGGISAFFFGGSDDAVKKSAANMEREYPGLKVKGTLNGYGTLLDNDGVVGKINEAAPDLLLVGLGSPKQEKWVCDNKDIVKASVIIVVGGSFDVMSGNIKRAPMLFRRLGLEWLYRLIRQPKRISRIMKLPIFVLKVLIKE